MNSHENAPRSQEQPEPQTQEQPTPEDLLAQLQAEVGDWHPQQMDQRLKELGTQREQLRDRLDKEAEAKGTLSRWMAQAREKLGRLTDQEKADREQLHHLDEQTRVIQEQRIKAGVKPESVADNDVEAGFFAAGDAMNEAAETKVSANETQDHKDLASVLAQQQLEIIQSDRTEETKKAIQEKYAAKIQSLMAAATEAGQTESATEQVRAYDQRTMADASAERTAPTEMQKMVIGETPENADINQNEQATIQAREVAQADAATEMIGEEAGQLDGDDSLAQGAEPTIGDTSAVGDAVAEPEFMMGDVESKPEPVVTAAEPESVEAEFIENPVTSGENPLSADIASAVDADKKANEAIRKLENDHEALGKIITDEFGITNLDDMLAWPAYDITQHLKGIAEKKQWKVPERNPQPKTFTERFKNFMMADTQPEDKRVSVDTVRRAVMQYRNLGREIAALQNTDEADQPQEGVIDMRQTGSAHGREEFAMDARADETSEEAVKRRLAEMKQPTVVEASVADEEQPTNVIEFPRKQPAMAAEAEQPTEVKKAA